MNMNENEALDMLKDADMKQMLTFLIDMLSAYPTEELIELKNRALNPGEVESGEKIVLVIDEILRIREASEK